MASYTFSESKINSSLSGMSPTIRAVLEAHLVGVEDGRDIEIVANDVDIHEDGKWEIRFRHPERLVTNQHPKSGY
jgi:2-hydroxy-3-keto-5-methylthiopentenyl-1-phosphate phosphatase